MTILRSALACAVTGIALSASGCAAPAEDDDGASSTDALQSARVTQGAFHIQAKSYIAYVTDTADQAPPGGSIAAFKALKEATNASFDEAPANGSLASGDFRLFGELVVKATCNGIRPQSLTISGTSQAAGKEGPLFGEIDPIRTMQRPAVVNGRTLGWDVTFVLAGRPAAAAEPGFTAVKRRTNRTIHQRTRVRVACGVDGPWLMAFPGGSNFPTHAVWVTDLRTGRVVENEEVSQGMMNQLWSLPAVPAP